MHGESYCINFKKALKNGFLINTKYIHKCNVILNKISEPYLNPTSYLKEKSQNLFTNQGLAIGLRVLILKFRLRPLPKIKSLILKLSLQFELKW